MLERDDPYFLRNFDEIVEAAAHRIAHNPTENGRNAVNDLYRLAFAQKNLLASIRAVFVDDVSKPSWEQVSQIEALLENLEPVE